MIHPDTTLANWLSAFGDTHTSEVYETTLPTLVTSGSLTCQHACWIFCTATPIHVKKEPQMVHSDSQPEPWTTSSPRSSLNERVPDVLNWPRILTQSPTQSNTALREHTSELVPQWSCTTPTAPGLVATWRLAHCVDHGTHHGRLSTWTCSWHVNCQMAACKLIGSWPIAKMSDFVIKLGSPNSNAL